MVLISKIKILFLILGCMIAATSFSQSGKFKVVLDAGHGGKDFGAVYNGHVEKKIALGVVLKVGKLLEKNPSVAVIYTRKSDVFVELDERARIANKAHASIFVSIHCNANRNSVAEGFETYIMGVARNASNLEVAKNENEVITLEKDYKEKYEGYDPGSPESIIGLVMQQEVYIENSIALAVRIQDNFASGTKRKNRSVKEAGFLVLRKITMPRVLVEMGFISNPREGDFLDSEEGQDEIASQIAAAIISYKKEYFGSEDNEPVIEKVKAKPVEEKTEVTPQPEEVKAPSQAYSDNDVVFKVQISASGKKLALTPSNFKGLSNISVMTEDNSSLYKYLYGETTSYSEAQKNLAEARSKGFTSAYLVAFKAGKKINLQDVIK
jgi:N-acetylmuramoyl-L-alanine amidase